MVETDNFVGHKKETFANPQQPVQNAAVTPPTDGATEHFINKAYMNLTASAYLMLYIQNTVERRIELEDEEGHINPILIQPKTTIQFGIALNETTPITLKGSILGTDIPVYLNQYFKLQVVPEKNIYRQAHIIVSTDDSSVQSKQSPYTSTFGGDIRKNISMEIEKALESSNTSVEFKGLYVLLAFHNTLNSAIQITEITGAIKPVMLLPFQVKRVMIVVNRIWPLIFRGTSGNEKEELLLNGQTQIRIYLPLESDKIRDIVVSLRQTDNKIDSGALSTQQSVMLDVSNSLPKPVVLFDLVNAINPLIIHEKQSCQVGFLLHKTDYILLRGVYLDEKPRGVYLNGYGAFVVAVSRTPASPTKIVITGSPGTLNTNGSPGTDSTEDVTVLPSPYSLKPKEKPTLASGEAKFVMLAIHSMIDKPVKIVEQTGVRKPFLIPPHSDSRVGFEVYTGKPAIFQALNPDNQEKYLVNGRDMLYVELSEDPGKITDITITTPITSDSNIDISKPRPEETLGKDASV